MDIDRASQDGGDAYRAGVAYVDNPYLDTRDLRAFRGWGRAHRAAELADLREQLEASNEAIVEAQDAHIATARRISARITQLVA